MQHSSHFLSKDDLREMNRMLASGRYSKINVARYLGISTTTLYYYINRKARRMTQLKYYRKNRDKILSSMRDYYHKKKHEMV